MIGMCCLPLKSVLQADALFLDRTLEVRDRSQAAGHNASSMQDDDWPLVGHLKVRIQLNLLCIKRDVKQLLTHSLTVTYRSYCI